MEMVLLLNGYPPKFITHRIKSFFSKFNAMSIWSELNAGAYQIFHQQLLHKPTRREEQLQKTSDHTDDSLLQRQRREHKNQILIHHTFETGPSLSIKLQYRQLWSKSYVISGTRISTPRLIIGTTINPCLQSLFIWKKPSREMLTRIEKLEQIPTTSVSR